MENNFLEIKKHPTLDILVREDGAIYKKDMSGKYRWTFGVVHDKRGYLSTRIQNKNYKMHRIVAETFLPNPNNLPQIDHKDRNHQNNSVYNLRWCDNKTNNRNKTNNKCVYQYSKFGEFIKKWDYLIDAEQIGGFHRGDIWKCCEGKAKSAYGYKWSYEYIPEPEVIEPLW